MKCGDGIYNMVLTLRCRYVEAERYVGRRGEGSRSENFSVAVTSYIHSWLQKEKEGRKGEKRRDSGQTKIFRKSEIFSCEFGASERLILIVMQLCTYRSARAQEIP